jgi:hypothetical protein
MRRSLFLALLAIAALPAHYRAQVAKPDAKKQPGTVDVDRAIIKLDRELIDAAVRKDKTVADGIEFTNHVFINPGGGIEIRGETTGDDPTFESVDTSDVTVRVYGDTAILIGLADVKGHLANGADITGQYRYMRVFVKQQGYWRLMATTATQIKPAPAPPKT